MDVRLPDGTIIKGVPDDMSKADLTEKLKSNGYDISKLAAESEIPKRKMSLAESAMQIPAGIYRGAKDVTDTAFKLGAKGIDYLTGGNVEDAIAQRAAQSESEYQRTYGGSALAGGGRLAGQVAATLPVGGAIAAPLRGAAAIAPRIAPAIAPVATAIESGGFRTGLAPTSMAGKAGELAIRSGSGGVVGGASAGLINPEDAQTGAIVGAALPVAGAVLGGLKKGMRGPEQSPELASQVKAAREAGYVIPPTQANASFVNRLLEGTAGKISTAQNASAKNQVITNNLASQAIGLAPDVKITPDVLSTVRKTAGDAYAQIGATGQIAAPQTYNDALDKIAKPFISTAQSFPNAKPSPVIDLVDSLRSSSFDAAAAVEKIKQLRTAADDAFRMGGNTDVARASKAAATALEDAIESHLQTIGSPELLQNFRNARQTIAKTYSIEKALNPATGSIDARKLAAELKKNKPLSGELRQIAEFSSAFPKATQTIEGMGSLPQFSPLDFAASGALSAGMGNPLGFAAMAIRPGARAMTLSPTVQNRLVQQPAGGSPALNQLIYRAAPALSTQ